MSYVIHGATGAQGAPLVAVLSRMGKDVTAAVRDTAAATTKAVRVDYSSVDSLVAAYRQAEGVFVHLPVTSEDQRLECARNISEAIGRARPRRVVISTSGWVVDEPQSALQGPHHGAAMTLIRGVEQTGVSMAVVAPRLFLENLLLPAVLGPAKSEGILRYPIRGDYLVSWSSHLDVAEVAARLLTDGSTTGILGVGHLPPLAGAELAEGFSQYLGQKVEFEGIAPETFGAMIAPLLGEAPAAGVVASYQAQAALSMNAIASNTSAQNLLRLAPRSVHQWLAEVGA